MPIQLKLEQHSSPPGKTALDALEHWIALLPAAKFEQACKTLPYGDFILRVSRRTEKPQRARSPVVLNLPNGIASQLCIAGARDKTATFDLLTLARRLVADPLRSGPSEIGIVIAGFHGAEAERMAEALLAAVLAAIAEMPRYKRSRQEKTRSNSYACTVPSRKMGFTGPSRRPRVITLPATSPVSRPMR